MNSDSWAVTVHWTAPGFDEPDGISLMEQLGDLRPAIAIGDVDVGPQPSVDVDLLMTVRVPASTLRQALATALGRVEAATGVKAVGVEAMTRAEERRRYERSLLPHLIGIDEIAEILDVTPERAAVVAEREDFPSVVLAREEGVLWLRWQVELWAQASQPSGLRDFGSFDTTIR